MPDYVSPNQLALEGFETPFEQSLNPKNRWVTLANIIPWDEICNLYIKHVGVSDTGRPPINPRVVLGSVIIKHLCNLDDRETVDQQQKEMYDKRTKRVDHRIVSIHQPHVRPMVRGKSQAKEVLADQVYCTRANRKALKLIGIKLLAKPLGRPPAVSNHVRPGERNPIEGKFGRTKTAYGLDRIHARLIGTSESMISSIIIVLNLVKLAGVGVLCLFDKVSVSFSARQPGYFMLPSNWKNENRKNLILNFGIAA